MDAAKWVGAEIIAVGISKQLAAIEACETIANEQGFLQIMGHEHRTDGVSLGDTLEQRLHVSACVRIEIAERFVE